MDKAWRTRALIDLSALRHNVIIVRSLASDARIFAVVKADAYGHGINNVVPAISKEVEGFAVATVEEGIRCRKFADNAPIMVLSEFSSPEQLEAFCKYRLQPVVHRKEQADWMSASDRLPDRVWLKFDSGMNRLGIAPEQVPDIVARLSESFDLQKIGLMSHLASADDMECDQTQRQIALFAKYTANHPGDVSLANSAGVVSWPQAKRGIVRPGLMLYGVSPTAAQSGTGLGLQPVMQLETRLIAVKTVDKGGAVGYGGSWIANQPTRIGVAGFGYADGYPRCISNRGAVMVNGRRAPVIGKVSMDMMTIDLSDCCNAVEGDIVQLWGSALSVDIVAHWAQTIAYELLCAVSPRVPRIIVN